MAVPMRADGGNEDDEEGVPELGRKRAQDWQRPKRARSADGGLNLVGPVVKARRRALGRTRPEFVADLSNVTSGRWAPSAADLLNIERRTRTVTDIELVALAEALRTSVRDLMGDPR